jgi:ribosome maturation factor RimP
MATLLQFQGFTPMGLAPIFCLRSDTLSTLERIVEESLQGLGYELVHLERGPRGLVRVFMDRRPGGGTELWGGGPAAAGGASPDGRVTLEDCERASNQISRVLTVEGIPYERLEVSSPGLDRVLKKPADFRRFAGSRAEVQLRVPRDGRRRFVGVLRAARDDGVDLEVDGTIVSVPFSDMQKARLVPNLQEFAK